MGTSSSTATSPSPAPAASGVRGAVRQRPGHLPRRAAGPGRNGRPFLLRRLEPLTCKDIFACAAQGDAVAAQVLDRTFAYMGEFPPMSAA